MLENRNIEFEIIVTCLKNQYIASYMVHTQLAYRVDCNTGWNSYDKTHLADLIYYQQNSDIAVWLLNTTYC